MIAFALITRLGWPWTYWEQGLGPSSGFLLICSLLFFGLCGIISGEDDKGDFIGGAICWLVAGLLLQAMPKVDGGIQLIPLSPWCYTGWIARIVSAVVWLMIGVACLIGISHLQADRRCAVFVWCLAFGLNALLSVATPVGVPQNPTVTRWEKLRSERSETLSKLRSDKDDLVSRIRNLGAKDKRQLMSNPLGRTLVEEYEQLSQQIVATQREVDALEMAIERAKSRQRMTERKGNGRLTEMEQDELSELDHQLERRHDPGHEVRLDKLLDEVLK